MHERSMEPIEVFPGRLRQYGEPGDATFCLVTNSGWRERFRLVHDGRYREHAVVTFDAGDDFNHILATQIPGEAHILVIVPDCYFRSPSPEALGPGRKLSIMACNSTPITAEAIEHFLREGENTDPEEQAKRAEAFFEAAEQASHLTFIDEEYDTRARFEHLDDHLEWHEQAGPLGPAEQQLFPAGELSTLPLDQFNADMSLRLRLDGDLAFKGYPVLHSGSRSFLRSDQARMFERLAPLNDHAVIAHVEDGAITRLTATHPSVEDARAMLEAMIRVDSRYAMILEIGFAINHNVAMLAGNWAMNEVHAGMNGSVHWGLGILPNTQYHLDLICPGTAVLGARDEKFFGGVTAQDDHRVIGA